MAPVADSNNSYHAASAVNGIEDPISHSQPVINSAHKLPALAKEPDFLLNVNPITEPLTKGAVTQRGEPYNKIL